MASTDSGVCAVAKEALTSPVVVSIKDIKFRKRKFHPQSSHPNGLERGLVYLRV